VQAKKASKGKEKKLLRKEVITELIYPFINRHNATTVSVKPLIIAMNASCRRMTRRFRRSPPSTQHYGERTR